MGLNKTSQSQAEYGQAKDALASFGSSAQNATSLIGMG